MRCSESGVIGLGTMAGCALAVWLIPVSAHPPASSSTSEPTVNAPELHADLPDWSGCTTASGGPVACQSPAIFWRHSSGRIMIAVLGSDDDQASDAMIQMWPSGRVEFAADYRLQAPAEAFWSAVAHLRMGDCGPLAYRALLAHGRAEQDVARSLRDLTAAQTAWQPPRGDLIDQANDLGSRALVCLRSVGIAE